MSMTETMGAVADVPVWITAELDRKPMSVAEILEIGVGSVVRMTRSADENIDIFAGGALLATGKIVAIEDSVAVRIADFPGEK